MNPELLALMFQQAQPTINYAAPKKDVDWIMGLLKSPLVDSLATLSGGRPDRTLIYSDPKSSEYASYEPAVGPWTDRMVFNAPLMREAQGTGPGQFTGPSLLNHILAHEFGHKNEISSDFSRNTFFDSQRYSPSLGTSQYAKKSSNESYAESFAKAFHTAQELAGGPTGDSMIRRKLGGAEQYNPGTLSMIEWLISQPLYNQIPRKAAIQRELGQITPKPRD